MLVRLPAVALLVVAFASPMPARADSPLTSIDFHVAYPDVAMITTASKTHLMDQALIDFLHNPETPLESKVAAVNALGVTGDPSLPRTEAFTKAVFGKEVKALARGSMRADELLVVGYLMTLDDFQNPARALPFLDAGKAKLPHSFTAALLSMMAHSHQALAQSNTVGWCGVWRSAERVLRDPKLQSDMRDAAVDIAFDYLSLFRESCPGARLRPRGAARGLRRARRL